MNLTGKKGRALALSFIMVMSVFGATIAFSGSAAAASSLDNNLNPVSQGSSAQDVGVINLNESDGSGEFGSSGTGVTISVSGGSFNQSASSLGSLTTSGTVSNLAFDNGEITFDYSGLDTSTNDDLNITGAAVDVDPDASAVRLTSNIAGKQVSSTTTLESVGVERSPSVTMSAGAQNAQNQNLTLVDNASANDINSLIENGTTVSVTLPSDSGVTFRNNDSVNINTSEGDGVVSNAQFVSDQEIQFDVDSSDGATNNVDDFDIGYVDGDTLAFNATQDASDADLTIQYTPNNPTSGGVTITDSNAVQITKPNLRANATSDILLGNDADGDTDVRAGGNISIFNVNTGGPGAPDKNVTVTIPDSAGFTFDLSNTTDSSGDHVLNYEYVDENTLNVTLDGDVGGSTTTENSSFVRYNLSSGATSDTKLQFSVNESGPIGTADNFINVTLAAGDLTEASIDGDNTFGTGPADTTAGGLQLGSTQTSAVRLSNSTAVGDNSIGPLGGEAIDLAVTDSPSDASASVNTSSVTTNSSGGAAFEVTLGSTAGTYNVTASNADDPATNITFQYTTTAGDVSQFNTTGQEDALIDTTGLSTDPSESTAQAVYKVRLEDASGNLNTSAPPDTEVKFSLSVSDSAATIENVSTGLANDGTAIGNTTPESGGTFTYNYTEDSNNPGIFHVFVSDPTAGDTDLTVRQSGTSDSGTVTFFDTPASVAVSFNNSNPSVGDTVAATATPQTSAGNPVTVGQLSVNFNSTNQTVATSADGSFPTTSTTDANGDALTNVSIDANGTTDINATTEGVSGISTITVEEEQLPTATVTFGDEDGLTVQNGSTSVDVASARFDGTEDFVIVVHRASPGDDGVVDGPSEIGDKIGSSDVLSGNVSDVSVNLTKNLDEGGNTQLTENQTLIAMVHFANESRPGDRNFDMPIVRSGSPVFDQAEITIAPESPLEGAAGDFDTDGNGDIDIRELGDAGQAFLDDELTIQELGEIGQEFLS